MASNSVSRFNVNVYDLIFAKYLFNFDSKELALKYIHNCRAIAAQKAALQGLESAKIGGFIVKVIPIKFDMRLPLNHYQIAADKVDALYLEGDIMNINVFIRTLRVFEILMACCVSALSLLYHPLLTLEAGLTRRSSCYL